MHTHTDLKEERHGLHIYTEINQKDVQIPAHRSFREFICSSIIHSFAQSTPILSGSHNYWALLKSTFNFSFGTARSGLNTGPPRKPQMLTWY